MVFTTYYWFKKVNNILISVRSWDLCHNLFIGVCCWTWTAVGKKDLKNWEIHLHSLLVGDKMKKRFQCLTLNSNSHVWVDKIFQKIFCLKPLWTEWNNSKWSLLLWKTARRSTHKRGKLFHYKLFYMFLILANYPIIYLLLKTLKAECFASWFWSISCPGVYHDIYHILSYGSPLIFVIYFCGRQIQGEESTF